MKSDTQILKTLIDAVYGREDEIPEGFKTTDEWMSEIGCCRAKVGKLIGQGIKMGIVEKRVLNRKFSGINRKVPYYRISQKQQKPSTQKKKG